MDGYGTPHIHLYRYVSAKGYTGRVVVGPYVWSLPFGEEANAVPDDNYLEAYLGWLFIHDGTRAGTVSTDFIAQKIAAVMAGKPAGFYGGVEQPFLETCQREGLEDVKIDSHYLVNGTPVFECFATRAGEAMRCGGLADHILCHPASSPLYHLPATYILMGRAMLHKSRP